MKKLVHVCLNGIYTEGFTYQENYLPKYHKKLGFEVTIITNEYVYNKSEIIKDSNHEYINSDGVNIIRIKIKNDKPFDYKFKKYPELYRRLEIINPDILFIHGLNFVDIVTLKKYLKNHKECVAYIDNHCDWNNSGTNWISLNVLHKLFWKHLIKPIIPYVKMFYGVQPIRVDWLTKVYSIPQEKCKLLIMGADDEYVNKYEVNLKSLRKELNIDDKDFIIVSGGKIDSKKTQVLDLMQAVNELGDINIKLIIFGSPTPELQDRFNSLLSNNVIYFGWISDPEESYKLFSVANLVCFPGRHSVYWEQCVAQGKPLLCNQLKGVDHIDIGGNVRFFDSSNIENIKKEIKRIVDNKKIYNNMVKSAMSEKRKDFLYSRISKDSIKE